MVTHQDYLEQCLSELIHIVHKMEAQLIFFYVDLQARFIESFTPGMNYALKVMIQGLSADDYFMSQAGYTRP